MLDGFITDVVAAEFWWRATQHGIKGPGQMVRRTYSEAELLPFLEAFAVLFEPALMERAPISRTLGRYAGLVGLPLGEFLYAVTGVDREGLLASPALSTPVTFESMDTADLHVLCGALSNGAELLCSSDRKVLSCDPAGALRIISPGSLAHEFGLIVGGASAAQVPTQT